MRQYQQQQTPAQQGYGGTSPNMLASKRQLQNQYIQPSKQQLNQQPNQNFNAAMYAGDIAAPSQTLRSTTNKQRQIDLQKQQQQQSYESSQQSQQQPQQERQQYPNEQPSQYYEENYPNPNQPVQQNRSTYMASQNEQAASRNQQRQQNFNNNKQLALPAPAPAPVVVVATNNVTTESNINTVNNNTTAKKGKNITEDKTLQTFSPCSRVIHTVIMFSYSVFALVFIIILMKGYPEYSEKQKELDNMMANWNMEAFEDISVVTLSSTDIANQSSGKCPSGYESLITFKGQPILAGCDCLSTSSNNLLIGTCTQKQLDSGCKSVPELVRPIGFLWETPETTPTVFNVCKKKISNITYKQYGGTLTCEKTCGGVSSDDTKFCVPSNANCPINYLRFGTTADTSFTGIKSIAIGSNFFVSYSDQAKALPIVDVTVTKGPGVCFDNTISNLESTSFRYPLMNGNIVQVCSTTDARYTQVLSLTEDKLLNVNYMTSKYTALPNYVISPTETYGVYTRSMLGLLPGSSRATGIELLTSIDDNYSMVFDAALAVLIITVFYTFIVGIVYSIVNIINLMSKRSYFKQYLFDIQQATQPSTKSSIFKKLLMKILISIMQFAAIMAAFMVTIVHYRKLVQIENLSTGDANNSKLFTALSNEFYDMILWYIVILFMVAIAMFFFEIVILVCLCSRKLSEDRTTKISKKYMSNVSQLQQQPRQAGEYNQSKSQMKIEMPEYQTHNIYAGNGINTSVNPLAQFQNQASFLDDTDLGVDRSFLRQNSSQAAAAAMQQRNNFSMNPARGGGGGAGAQQDSILETYPMHTNHTQTMMIHTQEFAPETEKIVKKVQQRQNRNGNNNNINEAQGNPLNSPMQSPINSTNENVDYYDNPNYNSNINAIVQFPNRSGQFQQINQKSRAQQQQQQQQQQPMKQSSQFGYQDQQQQQANNQQTRQNNTQQDPNMFYQQDGLNQTLDLEFNSAEIINEQHDQAIQKSQHRAQKQSQQQQQQQSQQQQMSRQSNQQQQQPYKSGGYDSNVESELVRQLRFGPDEVNDAGRQQLYQQQQQQQPNQPYTPNRNQQSYSQKQNNNNNMEKYQSQYDPQNVEEDDNDDDIQMPTYNAKF